MRTVAFAWVFLCCLPYAFSQNHTQTIRGKIIDSESLLPLIGASVVILGSNPLIGSSTDAEGQFRIDEVPIGRHSLEITYLGYEPTYLQHLLVTTGKEVVLEVKMTESLIKMEEVIVTANPEKSQPLNEMAIASARSFSVEETGRYASSLFDPARMAQNFAGVSTTGGTSDLFNEIIVRGNSPRGVLWKLEGIEIPNPNHFGSMGNSGGGISMLSSSLLSTSDFYTGAFPAEFGNATSAAFDLNLRKGNNQQREHSFMFGILGTEIASEGPIGPQGGASYLFNFRYSSLSILQKIGLNPVGDVLPEYGDLSFNLNFPTKHSGQFNVFGLMGKNRAFFTPEADSTAWEFSDDKFGFNERQTVATIGVAHKLLLSNDSYIHTVVAGSIDNSDDDEYFLDQRNNYQQVTDFVYNFENSVVRATSTFHQKINAKNAFEIGTIIGHHRFNFKAQEFESRTNEFFTYLQNEGSSTQFQAFGQWKHRISENWTVTNGLHFNYFGLTRDYSVEPRLASKWILNDRQSVHLAAGIHSKPEHPSFYLAETTSRSDETRTTPNAEVDYLKSLHLVAGYDHQFSANLRLKVEAYYQYLYDVPVEVDPNVKSSILNTLEIWDVLDGDKVNNDGRGKNIGLDLTLEKNFSRSYYFLATGSVFDSKFRTLAGDWYNTRFNSQYQGNFLFGKEFIKGQEKNKIFGVNSKFVINGGNRITPIKLQESIAANRGIYDFDNFLGESVGTYYRLDVGVSYKINRPKVTHSIMLDIQNVTNRQNPLSTYYSRARQEIHTDTHTGIFPVINYRVEF